MKTGESDLGTLKISYPEVDNPEIGGEPERDCQRSVWDLTLAEKFDDTHIPKSGKSANSTLARLKFHELVRDFMKVSRNFIVRSIESYSPLEF